MKLDTGSVLVILALASLAFMLVGLFAQWRVSRNTVALTQYRETAQAWEGKARAQEMEIEGLKTDHQRNQAKISELEGKVSVLQEALTGRASWDVLVSKMSEALAMMGETRTEITKMSTLMSEVLSSGRTQTPG